MMGKPQIDQDSVRRRIAASAPDFLPNWAWEMLIASAADGHDLAQKDWKIFKQ